MNMVNEWLKEEWKDKKFRSYMFLNIMVVALLLGEWYVLEYGWLKITRYLIMLEGCFGIAWIDRKTKRIPNKILLVLLVVRTVLFLGEWLAYPSVGFSVVISSVLGMILGGGLFLLCYLLTRGGVGMGDVKLFSVMGYYLGNGAIMPAMFFTVVISAVYSIVQLIRKKTKLKDEIPFAPFALVGIMITMLMGM